MACPCTLSAHFRQIPNAPPSCYPRNVFYASPALRDLRAFNRAYANGDVHRNSIFFSPGEIGPLPDPKTHSIAYRDGLSYAWLCSDPREIHATGFVALEEEVRILFDSPRFRTLRVAVPELREKVRAMVSAPMREAEDLIAQQVRARRAADSERRDVSGEETIDDILIAREMIRSDLGVDLVIAQKGNDSQARVETRGA